ncbi:MAG: GNAT family N-acetyltransferase [Actinomycetota bacterium]|nr:GNAT family N-acetyltransferase [Actinomycetota bacterium]
MSRSPLTVLGVDVLLVDGQIATIRPVGPDDAALLTTLYDGLSTDTLYLRFFTRARNSAERDIVRLLRTDPDCQAFLVELGGTTVAVAGYERLADRVSAEVALVVADHLRGVGIGTLLVEHLAATALADGITRFVAETLPENARMLHVFRDVGLPATARGDHGVVHVEIPLATTEGYLVAVERREAQADAASLARVLAPRSVVVVGAGSDPIGLGHQVLANIVAGGFQGQLAGVNRSGGSVCGQACYPTLLDVPGEIDLVVIAVPVTDVLPVARAAATRGAAALVVITAGFAEAGPSGAGLQADLLRICRTAGMRLIGPNCMGIANAGPGVSLNATFCATLPPAGGIALMSQSGAVGIAALRYAARTGVGISSFVSAGNKPDVSGNDLLCYWERDPRTTVCALYLESFGNPRKFARIAARVGRTKPIIAVKSGRSASGARGVASHTAAAATPDITVDSLFAQAGVIRVDTLAELLDVATVLDRAPLPGGRRVAIIGNSGGPGVLAADACERAGLLVPALSESTSRALAGLLPGDAVPGNPVDLLAGAGAAGVEAALRILVADPEIDAVITVYTPVRPGAAEEVAAAIARVRASRPGTPILSVFLGVDEIPRALRDGAGGPVVPYFTFPEAAASSLAAATRYAEWRARPPGHPAAVPGLDRALARAVVESALRQAPDGGWLDPSTAARLVASYGIHVAETVPVTDADQAVAVGAALGGTVAVKAAAADLVHKTELGAVRLDLTGPEEIRAAYDDMADRLGPAMHGAVVQPMVGHGVETAVGVAHDSDFGPMVMFGLGGVASDLLADRAFRLLPMSVEDAADLVRSLRGAPLLFGYRGTPSCDVRALEDMILRVARLAEDLPELAELDLNPVIAGPDGAIAVDVKVRLQPVVVTDRLLRRLR